MKEEMNKTAALSTGKKGRSQVEQATNSFCGSLQMPRITMTTWQMPVPEMLVTSALNYNQT